MNTSQNSKEQVPLSLDLAFEWVKDVLDKQSNTADRLDAKGTTLFTVATLVLGIGISAGVLILKETNIITYVLGGLSLISYGFVVGFIFVAWSLRHYQTLDNPVIIREWYWDMQPAQFKIELLSHLEDAYEHNEIRLREKTNATRGIIAGATAEVILLVLALAFTL